MAEKTNETVAAKVSRVWQSRPVAWASVVVLILAIVVAAVMVGLSIFAPAKPEGAATPVPAPSSATGNPTPTAQAQNGPCNVPVGDTSLRPPVPKDLRWEAAQGLTWPVSGSVGPTKTVDGFPACFANSPLGAALLGVTMMNEQYRGHSTRSLTEFYVADGPGKKIMLDGSIAGGNPAETSGAGISQAGFIVDSFTPTEAHVTIVLGTPGSSTGYSGMPLTFVWVGGDWKIKALDSGNLFAGSPSAPVKGQFVEWRK